MRNRILVPAKALRKGPSLKHKRAEKAYEKYMNTSDSCSMLEHIRAFQLQDIFGKYKLF